MAKAKTSKKREAFSLESLPVVALKRPAKAVAYSPTEKLRDVDFVVEALFEALADEDISAFKAIVRAHFEARNTAEILRATGINRRTFYDAISAKGNPGIKTVAKIIHGIKGDSPKPRRTLRAELGL